jgi:alpha-L-fucosidase
MFGQVIHYPRVKGWPTVSKDMKLRILYGNIPRQEFLDMWKGKLMEVIDKYQPDLMWFDSWLNEIPDEYKMSYLAYYFNEASEWDKDVVVTFKQEDLPQDVGVLDLEKGWMGELTPFSWLTDDTLSKGSWCYTQDMVIKPTSVVLHSLIDIVSKNGVLLLNISPKADGTIPDNQQKVLLEIGEWLKKYGEAIYSTSP